MEDNCAFLIQRLKTRSHGLLSSTFLVSFWGEFLFAVCSLMVNQDILEMHTKFESYISSQYQWPRSKRSKLGASLFEQLDAGDHSPFQRQQEACYFAFICFYLWWSLLCSSLSKDIAGISIFKMSFSLSSLEVLNPRNSFGDERCVLDKASFDDSLS